VFAFGGMRTELLRELFGARISVGSVEAILQHAALALDEPYEDLLGHIRAAPALNIDETGWRLRGGKRTLWGALSGRAAVFRIAEGRHRREAQALLGEDFSGVACSDRWWAYDYLDPKRRQFCSRAPGARLHRPQRGPRRRPEAVRRGRP